MSSGMYFAPLFDGFGKDGKPIADRPAVHRQDVGRIVEYLKNAPVVLAARAYDKDRFAPDQEPQVPLTFHTDGAWVWSGATAYYLEKWGVAPVRQLVRHIRIQDYRLPEVDEAAKSLGVRIATDQAKPLDLPPYPERVFTEEERDELDRVTRKLAAFGVPKHVYNILGEPTPLAWLLEPYPDSDQWQLSWWDENLVPLDQPYVFHHILWATAHLLGRLLLDERLDPEREEILRGRGAAAVAGPAVVSAVEPVLAAEPASIPAPVATDEQATPAVPQSPSVQQTPVAPLATSTQPTWTVRADGTLEVTGTIEPLPGEPPFTLLATPEPTTLPAGFEVDRFGNPDGNLVFAIRTPYQNRSLPPDWADRGYHVYRLLRTMPVITGVTVPWFGQPGGGRAFYLPSSVDSLIASGNLIDVTPPPNA